MLGPMDPVSRGSSALRIRALWGLLGAVLFAASLHIPVFSGMRPGNGVVGHPALFPYYFQTNADAPLELASSLGFPSY